MIGPREDTINDRERWRETVLFGNPDKIPFSPGDPRESTVKAWSRQGFPDGVDWHAYLLQVLGIEPESGGPRVDLGISFAMLPPFEEKILGRRDGHLIVQDQTGAIVEISDQFDFSYLHEAKDLVTRKWHRFPVEGPADWDKIEWRYDPRHPKRLPCDFEERCRALAHRDYRIKLTVPGVFWQLRDWCGFENLCIFMKTAPDFVQAMVDYWSNFILQMLERIFKSVTPDHVQINEDMAYKEHSMISPAMTRRFLLPVWKQWTSALRAAGCPIISMDCDGYIGELLPLWLEAGFNHTWPVEVAAGNDIVAFRHAYGRQMAFGGGIDKRAIAAGGAAMRAQVLRVVPPLLREGGYIPGCDHGLPSDVTWQDFVDYARLLAQLTGWLPAR